MNTEKKLQDILDSAVSSGEECGCQLTVYRHGELLYDMCAGYTDVSQSRKVTHETLFPVFSVGKGIASTLMHILAEQKKLSYDDKVVKFWPEYGCCGKEQTKISDVMSHRAGLFNVPSQLSFEEWFDWEKITSALAEAEPDERIGGIHHYHAHTFGALTGRIAELADGRSFRQILHDEVLKPLHIDTLFFGIPTEKYAELAPIDDSVYSDFRADFNKPAVLSGLNPSSNGCANARALARFYAAHIGNGVDGVRLLTPETVKNATILRRSEDDNLPFENWDKFGLGYALCGPQENMGRMFGHGGAVGSEGFADKETGYAVGFTKNRINTTHPAHPTRSAISRVLGIPERIW